MKLALIAGCVSCFWIPTVAGAYETRVPTRDWQTKLASDDGVAIEIPDINTGQLPSGGVVGTWTAVQGLVKFSVSLTGGTAQLTITNNLTDGRKPPVGLKAVSVFLGSDRLYDVGQPKTFTIRVYVSADFTWIEAIDQSSASSAARSVVFFTGPRYEVVAALQSEKSANIRYFNYNEIKYDVSTYYAERYEPLGSPEALEMSRRGMALLNTILR